MENFPSMGHGSMYQSDTTTGYLTNKKTKKVEFCYFTKRCQIKKGKRSGFIFCHKHTESYAQTSCYNIHLSSFKVNQNTVGQHKCPICKNSQFLTFYNMYRFVDQQLGGKTLQAIGQLISG